MGEVHWRAPRDPRDPWLVRLKFWVSVPSRLARALGTHGGSCTATAAVSALLPREPTVHPDSEKR